MGPIIGGRCIDQVNGFYCLCQGGKIGLNCHQTIDNPCSNQNFFHNRYFFEVPSVNQNVYLQCTGLRTFEVRKCPDNLHWHQEEQTCTIESSRFNIGICMTFPCKNGGECLENDSELGFTCSCKSGYTGTQCEKIIDFCATKPCQNGGKCLPYAGGYTCICKENVIDECCCNSNVFNTFFY